MIYDVIVVRMLCVESSVQAADVSLALHSRCCVTHFQWAGTHSWPHISQNHRMV